MLHARDVFYFPNAFRGKAASGIFLNLMCMLCHRFIYRLPEPLNHRGNHAGIQTEPSFMREPINMKVHDFFGSSRVYLRP